MTVGQRIQERREQLGLSQTQLATRMGYSNRSAISRAETSGDEIGANRIKKFAEALNCSPSYLMGWEVEAEDDTIILELYRNADDMTKEAVKRLLAYSEKLSK